LNKQVKLQNSLFLVRYSIFNLLMAINKNHEFEELNGIKCAIVEKNATSERVAFLKQLLEFNRYEVVVAAAPPAKVAVTPKPTATPQPDPAPAPDLPEPNPQPPPEPQPPAPEMFTVGVTDVGFNATNAIFGRLLRAPGGHIVTLAYWQQKETVSHDEVPYYENVSK
jgi:hypothetical protein